ncbi:LuxR C-terminal-related transcriptional regulator [Streptomyces paludis]|uniref:LuxR family transcriptional regulator n=1 Tax=Streptomyces paludis TaxID=2282738 RepID=A0A345HIT3_9ACTN|nr:LuxR C-terminal-related transcriptional regulator [Streptomyces paludis]AXG76607.1 LuxR family transcriptional regulator [Streptomyces paludis]
MGPPARPLPPVRGRQQQLAQMNAHLHGVTSTRRSKVLLIEAARGAGKTRLLVEAVAVAGRNGVAVVSGASAAPEAYPGPSASGAIEAARARLREDAEQLSARPTVVALDDLHLANLPALTALCDLVVAYAGRPVLWLLAFASDRQSAPYEPVKTCLAGLQGRVPVEPVRELGPLPGDALAQLVADCAGAVPGPALLALAESVNGTPRAVIELVRGLMEDGDLRVVDGAARLRPGPPGGAPAGGVPAPVPKRFAAMIQRDLRSLAAPTVKALRLAAVLGSPFAPEDLSAMLGEAPAGLLAAVDEAVNRGILVCGERDLAFRGEPVWRVLLDSVPLPVRALLRRQAAELLLSRPDGVARAALQLAHIARPGDAEALRVIAEGSRRLLATDPSAAASLATRGMELLPPGHADRLRLGKTAVDAFIRAGAPDRAVTLAKETIEEAVRHTAASPPAASVPAASTPAASASAAPSPAPPPTAPAGGDIAALRASMSAALLLLGDARTARRVAGDALAARDGGFQQPEAVIAHLAASCLTGDSAAAGRAREILGAPDHHAPAVRVGAMAFHALGQWRAGHVGDALGILRGAVALDREGEDARLLDPRWFLASALIRTDEYEEASAVIRCSARTAGSGTGTPAVAVAALLRAPLRLAQGRLDEAEKEARSGVGADGSYLPVLAPQAWLVLTLVALRRGALTQAEDHIKSLEKGFPQDPSGPWWAARLLLNAQVAEARSGSLAATEVLAEIGADAGALRELVLEDPAAAAWCVRCALAADTPDIARAVVDTTEYLRTRNGCVPAVLAAAAHARALAEGDADAVARAGRLHRNPWARAAAAEDHAGLLLARGARGDRETAIGELDRAMSGYGALGGERDAARVRARLRGLGVRRRHWTHTERPVSGWESLTKTERKVAELVADGLTNQQAAHHLFISPHTVGFHLRQIYRKLGIRSRMALTRFTA